MTNNLIFLGPPGSGKGTQIEILREKNNLTVISSGDIVRNLAKENMEYQNIMEKGELLNDDILFSEINKRVEMETTETGLIFDGFPRNVAQAIKLDQILLQNNRILTGVIYIELDEEEVVKRLTIRKVCEKCGQPVFDAKICSRCGGNAIIRKDDNETTIRNRMKVFLDKTLPLVNYYRTKNKLIKIDGKQTIEAVGKDISENLTNV